MDPFQQIKRTANGPSEMRRVCRRFRVKSTQLTCLEKKIITNYYTLCVWTNNWFYYNTICDDERHFYLLPPYSQNGTVPSFCAKYGGLNEYLYSKR